MTEYVVHSFPTPVVVSTSGQGDAYVVNNGAIVDAAPAFNGPALAREQDRDYRTFIWLFAGVVTAAAASVPPVEDYIWSTQEQPALIQPIVKSGIQGPNVGSGITNTVVKTQEQPYHPLSKVWSGVYVPPATPNLLGITAITRQELPDHPYPRALAGPYGANVSTPVVRYAIGRQELPYHPLPSFQPGIQTTLASPVINYILGRQEQPYHPLSTAQAGVYTIPAAIFAPPVSAVFTTMELPWHPNGLWLLPAFPFVPPQCFDADVDIVPMMTMTVEII